MRPRPPGGCRGGRQDRAQATVETALLMPLLGALLVAVVAAGVAIRDELLVVHAAREAARAVSVEPTADAARAAVVAALGDEGREIDLSVGEGPTPDTRRVRVSAPVRVPPGAAALLRGRRHVRELVVVVEQLR